jgi:protein involved in polysaccharide export with SLBB domain
MTVRIASLQRSCAALVSAAILLISPSAFSQGMPDLGMMPTKAEMGANSSLSGVAAGGSGIGRMDTMLGTPVIRSDDTNKANLALVKPTKSAEYKPLPLNDFQQFVKDTAGLDLPLYGTDFFAGKAGTSDSFAPQTNTPVSADYRIGPGDELQIKGWGSVDIDVRAVVDRNGLIHIPRVGSINLSGVKSSQAEATVRSAVGRYYRDFELSVTQGQLRGMTVYVVGQARQPGAYLLSGASTLISALFASGGPNQLGSMRHVQVKRSDRVITELDLYDFIARGDKSADIKLQDGDTIVIPPAVGFVALTGSVSVPAVYELDSDKDTLASVLAVAGGMPVMADPKRAYLERVDPTQKPSRVVEAFALDTQSMKKKLRNGDLLTIMTISPEFANAVTLRGNVDQPVRTPWREGLRIRDLIPNKSFLMSRASVQRQNSVLRTDDTETTLAGRVGQLVDEINLDYAVVERVNSQQVTMELIPFNLGRALDDANSPDNMVLKAGDVVTVFSVNDVRVPQAKRQVFVRVEGEVASPGFYQMKSGEGLLELINQAGGLTPDAYLFGAEFYREQVRQTQTRNLERMVDQLEMQLQNRLNAAIGTMTSSSPEAVQSSQLRMQTEMQAQQRIIQRLRSLKPSGRVMLGLASEPKKQRLPVLKLENQDRLVVPAKPDFVFVLGAVNAESALIWQSGKSAKYYMDQSGLTYGADADEAFILRADGSVITRNSVGWFSSVAGAVVLQGDTIVLPEKIISESAWSVFTRNAKDVTQIIYQFSLGAAAIKTLRD